MNEKYDSIQNIQYFFVCLLFASLNFEFFAPFVDNFSVAMLVAIIYVLVSLLTPIKELFSLKNINKQIYSVFAMYILMVLSSIINANDSIFNTTIFLNIILFWLILNHCRRDNRVFKKGLLWFSISACSMGICYLNNIGVSIDAGMRVQMFGDNSNGIGIKMATGALYLINYCLNHSPQKHIYKPVYLLMLIPMLYLTYATASRTALLIIAIGCITFIILRPSKNKRLKITWLALGVFMLYIGYTMIQEQDVLISRMQTTIEDGNTSGRDYIWEKYFCLIAENPIIGVGFTGANNYAMQVFYQIKSPHNVLIEVLLYSGILGLLCFLSLIYYIFRDAWKFFKYFKDLGPLTTSITLLGIVLSGQALDVKLFWIFAAYTISYQVINKETVRNNYIIRSDS